MDSFINISFIIPVYNGEKTIIRCLDSILLQDFTNYEIIIIDDGSTDETKKVFNKYIAAIRNIKNIKIPNITFLSQKNAGVSSARNLGIETAKGKWISFIDVDDILFSDSLKKISKDSKLSSLINKMEVDFILFNLIYRYKNTQKEVFHLKNKLSNKIIDSNLLLKKYNYTRDSSCGCLYNLNFLNKNNIRFNQNLNNSEDALFFALVQFYSSKMYYKNIDFYCYLITNNSSSSLWMDKKIINLADSLKIIETILNTRNILYSKCPLFNIVVYKNISYTYHKFFSNNLNKKTLLYLREKIDKSNLYPLYVKNIPFKYKLKMLLMNFSIRLFEKVTILQCFFSNL